MTTRKGVRADLADNVIPTAIINGNAVRCVGFIPDAIPAPCATVWFEDQDPHLVLGDAKSGYRLTVRLWVPRTNERTGQDWLDDACEISGATSVVAAIQDDANWTVTHDYAEVKTIGGVQEMARGDNVFLIVDLDVEVVW